MPQAFACRGALAVLGRWFTLAHEIRLAVSRGVALGAHYEPELSAAVFTEAIDDLSGAGHHYRRAVG